MHNPTTITARGTKNAICEGVHMAWRIKSQLAVPAHIGALLVRI